MSKYSRPKHATKRDENESSIVLALRQVGATVWLMDTPCDLLVGFRGNNYLLEVKNPGDKETKTAKGKKTKDQEEFFKVWNGQVNIVYNYQEAFEIIGV